MKLNDFNTFYDILRIYEKRSTCKRLQVAAILVKNGRIISTGWNGVTSGKTHCFEIFDDLSTKNGDFSEKHAKFSNANESHAEMGAIGFAARNGISTEGTTMFVSVAPCINCAKLIVASGIKMVYYIKRYDREDLGIQFLEDNDIPVEQLNANI